MRSASSATASPTGYRRRGPETHPLLDAVRTPSQAVRPLARQRRSPRFTACFRPPIALPIAGPLPHGPHLEADICAWHNHRTPTSGFDMEQSECPETDRVLGPSWPTARSAPGTSIGGARGGPLRRPEPGPEYKPTQLGRKSRIGSDLEFSHVSVLKSVDAGSPRIFSTSCAGVLTLSLRIADVSNIDTRCGEIPKR